MPNVSVIIPTYNHRDHVLGTLDSVFAQTFADYEVIVVNDGSPDDTAELLRPLATSGRIKYVEQPNGGQAAARNRGLAESQGEFIAFLDDDDLWPADKLAWQAEYLRQHADSDLVWGDAVVFGESAGVSGRRQNPRGFGDGYELIENLIVSPGQTLMRRRTLGRLGGFNPALCGTDDWDLYIRMAEVGRMSYVPRLALHYRLHGQNASRQSRRMEADYERFRRIQVRRIEAELREPHQPTRGRKRRAAQYALLAWSYHLEHDVWRSRQNWLRAACTDPSIVLAPAQFRQCVAAMGPSWLRRSFSDWRRRRGGGDECTAGPCPGRIGF